MPWLIPDEAWPILLEIGLLALFNIVAPLTILRLAARKRPWTVRLLLALSIAAGIPWGTFLFTIKSLNPPLDDPATWAAIMVLAGRSLFGLPIVAYAVLIGRCFLHRPRSRVIWLAGLTALASFLIAVVMLWSDMMFMIAFEHYVWWGWYEVSVWGALAVGCLALVAWPIRGAMRLGKRLRRRAAVVADLP